MSIQEHLNKIRNAVYGHEVRESIAKGIETAYDDASENGNANMEVKIARGNHDNLSQRLLSTDQQLAQTVKKNTTDLSINMFNEGDRAVLQGMEPGQINAVLGERNVEPLNTTFFEIGKNKINPEKVRRGVRISQTNGNLIASETSSTTEMIRVSEGQAVCFTASPDGSIGKVVEPRTLGYGYYDENFNFINYKAYSAIVTAVPEGAKWVQGSYHTENEGSIMLEVIPVGSMTSDTYVKNYEPFHYKIPNEMIEKRPLTISDIPRQLVESIEQLEDDFKSQTIGVENAMSSWWIYPLSVYYEGIRKKDYHGFTDNIGQSGVVSHDHESGEVVRTVLATSEVDDHNAMAVEVMPDGKIIVAYSYGHNSRNTLHVRISERREDVSDFGEEITINVGQPTSYAQLFHKSGKWFLFTRMANNWWGYTTSIDGRDWTAVRRFIAAGMQYYVKVTETTNENILRLTMYSNPKNGSDTNIREGFFNTQSEKIQLIDGSILEGNDIDRTNFPIIIPLESGKRQRLLDVAITPPTRAVIGYATFVDESNQEYKVGVSENSVLTIRSLTHSGKAFYSPSIYTNGLCFGNTEQDVYLSQEFNNIWSIQHWQKSDEGKYFFVRDVDVSTQGIRNIRPNFTKNGRTLKWIKGEYNTLDYTDFYTDYKMKKMS